IELDGKRELLLVGGTDRGVLYGAFHILRLIGMGVDLESLHIAEQPKSQLRMINQWDNADGSIERGYAGGSIFYTNGELSADTERIRDYARLLASVGINAISINNVNVHEIETRFIMSDKLPDVARVAAIFRAYGIQI